MIRNLGLEFVSAITIRRGVDNWREIFGIIVVDEKMEER